MSIFYKMLGHKIGTGYANRPGDKYLELHYVATDGMGIRHFRVRTPCARCGATFAVGMIHAPTPKNESAL